MRRLLPLLVVVMLAGCGHGESAAGPSASDLSRLVLQPADVPGLDAYDAGRITRFDAPEGPRADLRRFGRIDGWKADYKTAAASEAAKALVVHSQVDLFGSSGGARRDLGVYEEQFRGAHAASPRSVRLFQPQLGDDAAALALRQQGTPPLRIYTVAWVDGAVSASVSVNGFDAASQAVALRFARRQERRIAGAERSR